ncbi:MAG: type 4a pilus biogenesis protein PilO [Candidatus Aminicenantales bacterium]
MTKRFSLVIGLGACLALAGCQSGPSSSAPDSTEEEERALAVERQAGFLEGLLGGRHTVARLMGDLTAALPDRVRLTEGVYESAQVQIKGQAPTNTLLADYIARLGRSAVLRDAILQSTVQKGGRGAGYQEFLLRALVRDPGGVGPEATGCPAARLEELEKLLSARQENAEMLREFQRLALGSGVQTTKFAPGNEFAGEFYTELPVAIEVSGSQAALTRYFSDLAGSPSLWLVEKFSFKAVSPQDARSPVRASITARTYLLR